MPTVRSIPMWSARRVGSISSVIRSLSRLTQECCGSQSWPQRVLRAESDRRPRFSHSLWPLLGLIALLAFTPTVHAHPVSLTETYVYVTREKVTVRIDAFLEDLYLFHNLKPNEQDFLEPDVIRQGTLKHQQFLLERFVIRDVDGKPLQGRIVGVKDAALPADGVPLADLMAHKLSFEFEYALEKAPEFLTFSQHLVDRDMLVPAEMNLVIKQENAGSPFGAFLQPHQPEIVRFSWENPPLSPEASEAEWDQWYQKQKEETLGITSYSSVYSFLYIEDFEVRHEILVPLLSLEESVLIARDEDGFLDLAEQDAAREQIEAYFTSGNPVEIDGLSVAPVVQRIDFYGLNFKDFAVQAERRPVSIANARVGVILSYGTKGSPSQVRLTWDRFSRFIWNVNVIVYAYDQTEKATLSRIGDENQYEWRNPGRPALTPVNQVQFEPGQPMQWRVPLLSLGLLLVLPALIFTARLRGVSDRRCVILTFVLLLCAAASWPFAGWKVTSPFQQRPQVSIEQARTILATLHKNIYRAFDYRDESQIYDSLAKSVDGQLLEELYLKIRRGLAMQEQGGAISRVREVALLDGHLVRVIPSPRPNPNGFEYRCRWTVNGTVQHWGHVHSRTNQYEATFRVEPRDQAWKITQLEVLDEQRLKFETSLRGL